MKWLDKAKTYIGVKEIKGVANNEQIVSWLVKLNAWWKDDETPWCGVFVAHVLKETGYATIKTYYRARDWMMWGNALSKPCVGCVVVFVRTGGGHVGFVVGKDKNNNLLVLGGNQGDSVSIAAFDINRAVGYRWPKEEAMPKDFTLPVLDIKAKLSTNEA